MVIEIVKELYKNYKHIISYLERKKKDVKNPKGAF
jgi:hypothetical protein